MAQGIDAINGLLERTKRIDTLLSDGTLIRNAVAVYEDEIIVSNRNQMYAGYRADGSPIKPDYTQATREIKIHKQQPYDRVTLKDTGRFYEEMTIYFDDDSFDIDSEDWKASKLKDKYGEKIFGLTESNANALSELMQQVLIEDIDIIYSE
jgi:hypothetical protein